MWHVLILSSSLFASPETRLLGPVPETGFVVAAKVSLVERLDSRIPCWTLEQSGGTRITLLLSSSSADLSVASPESKPKLAGPWTLPDTDAGHRSLALSRQEDWVRLSVDGVVLGEAEGVSGTGGVLSEQVGVALTEDLRIQPLAPIEFSDDFMREKDSLGEWSPQAGTWTIEALEHAELSASPFALRGRSSPDGILLAGQWFWNDFALQASVRVEDPKSSAGLMWNWGEGQAVGLLRWSGREAEDDPGRLSLWRIDGEKRRLLGEAEGAIPTGRWLAMEIITSRGELVAGVEGVPVIAAKDPRFTGGQIGLFVQDGEALFDDVAVRSVKSSIPLESHLDLSDRTSAPVREKFVGDAYMTNWTAQLEDWTQPPLPGCQLFDYTFYQAPTDWAPGAGTWTIAPRWICLPDFSWMRGDGQHLVSLWHDWTFSGDLIVEAYIANGMPRRIVPHYERNPNRSLTLCGDGVDPLSGYSLVWGGPDFPTRLIRQRQVVAESKELVNPMVRKDYDKLVTHLHRRWTALRLEKRGAEIRALVDGKQFFSFVDPAPLDSGRVGIWSWEYALTAARVRIAAQKADRPSWSQIVGDAPKAEVRTDGPLRVNQTCGRFRINLIDKPFDPEAKPTLSFKIKPQAASSWTLVAETEAGTFAAPLCGSDDIAPTMMPLGFAKISADGQWHTVKGDLLEAMSRFRPEISSRIVNAVYLENLSGEGLVLPELGLSPPGAWVGVKDVSLKSRHQPPKAAPIPTPGPVLLRMTPDPRLHWDDFDTRVHNWRSYGGVDGATPFVMSEPEEPNGAFLRGVNLQLGGTFGLYAVTEPYDLGRYPWIAFDLRMKEDIFIQILLNVDGVWEEIGLAGPLHELTPIAQVSVPVSSGSWQRVVVNALKAYMDARKPCRPPVVRAVAFGETAYYSHVSGAYYDIDNFQILSEAPSDRPIQIETDAPGAEAVRVELIPPGATAPTILQPGPDGRVEVKGLSPGVYALRVRGERASGSQGAASETTLVIREPFTDKDPPALVSASPGEYAEAGDKTVTFEIKDEGAGVDLSSVMLKVAESTYDLASGSLKVDPCAGKWGWDGNALGSWIGDGAVSCILTFSDMAGNEASFPWQWVFNAKLDVTPPTLGCVSLIPSPFLRWVPFEEGTEGWRSNHASVVDWGEWQGPWNEGHAIRMRQFGSSKSDSGVLMDLPSFSAKTWPIFSMDVLLEEGVSPMQIQARIHTTDYQVIFPNPLPKGTWTHVILDLEQGLKGAKATDPELPVQFMVLMFTDPGTMLIDNVCLSGRDPASVLVRWGHSEDASGVTGCRYAVNADPESPWQKGDVTDAGSLDLPLQGPGPLYLHLQAGDRAGNWGPLQHVMLKEKTVPPTPSPTPAPAAAPGDAAPK